MLAIAPQLTSAQCSAILQRTSQPMPGSDYAWRKDAGFGAVNPERALREAAVFDDRVELS
jgi:hypothetical protein